MLEADSVFVEQPVLQRVMGSAGGARILVLARGRIVADLPPTATDDEVGRLMLGMMPASAEASG